MEDDAPSAEALAILVEGICQGVGFRPFTVNLAQSKGVSGYVMNTESGVNIRVEGAPSNLSAFLKDLVRLAPPLSRITRVSSRPETVSGLTGFSIRESEKHAASSALVPPDACVCRACLDEIFDEKDRRHRYAFTNCTHCGPRFTIIEKMPYDRRHTGMSGFSMCEKCSAEYDDQNHRRFHAQPNACADCGPKLGLLDANGAEVAGDPLGEAGRLLGEGYIVAVKGLGGFHLAADAENDRAVNEIRRRKNRFEKPLALMCRSVDEALSFARVTQKEKRLLESVERPIVILSKKEPNRISPFVAPGLAHYGVMLAYTPLHHLLLADGFSALVMTSANRAGEPLCANDSEALERLAGIADFFLTNDRPIINRCDDSVAWVAASKTGLLRRSRGYAPSPVFLKQDVIPLLAVGAQLKNTFCLASDDRAFLSQHIGGLDNLETLNFFSESLKGMKSLLEIAPEIVAHDMHPDYLSTRYALKQEGKALFGVFHHHAHIASVMAENGVSGPVIGLAADGAGLGPDGKIWGGEALIADFTGFRRAGHLSYSPMPGGEAAVREPWRMALGYLLSALGEDAKNLPLPLWEKVPPGKIGAVSSIIEKSVNCPLTSSLGRLFDGVAAMAGIRTEASYEGQAAMEIEAAADVAEQGFYEGDLITDGDGITVSVFSIIRAVARDISRGAPVPAVSGRFHNTLVRAFTELCIKIRLDTGIGRVAISGGVFQNRLLFSRLVRSLKKSGFQVFVHRLVPANDGGICLGQALVASACVKKGLSHALVE
ncbi:MAG: carbamoyltransferase HypF [Deltaproteobacteria bacterium]|nr:carbamoyltransferase HypF [Deltaproteobacteria bacterium]